jgi:hypothetical protein
MTSAVFGADPQALPMTASGQIRPLRYVGRTAGVTQKADDFVATPKSSASGHNRKSRFLVLAGNVIQGVHDLRLTQRQASVEGCA